MYRIAWVSKLTKHRGHGNWYQSRDGLEIFVAEMNKKFPDIWHWVESQE